MKLLPLVITTILMTSTSFAQTNLEDEKKLASEYLTKMQAEPNTRVLDNGVIIRKVFQSQATEFPTVDSKVTVLYEGFDREGNIFDSAFKRDIPATFALSGLINCWQTAIPEISVGSVYKVSCPSETAYGDKGYNPGIKAGAAISFRIMVLEILK